MHNYFNHSFFLMKDLRVALEIIHLVRAQYFSEKVIFLTPLIQTRTCVYYQWAINVAFSENVAHVVNEWLFRYNSIINHGRLLLSSNVISCFVLFMGFPSILCVLLTIVDGIWLLLLAYLDFGVLLLLLSLFLLTGHSSFDGFLL